MDLELNQLQTEWHAMRALTLDLLGSCSQDDLHSALDGLGPVWKQFRHIGRVHENYLNALRDQKMAFDVARCSYAGGASVGDLSAYFGMLAHRHADAFGETGGTGQVEWPDRQVSRPIHLLRLLNHEVLHHGQFVLQWRVRGMAMPPGWQIWGV